MAQIRIKNDIAELDFTKNFVHTSNQVLIHEIIFKYQLASNLTQLKLVKIGIPNASKIVNIEGIRVHLVLNWLLKFDSVVFGLWGFPDEDKYIEKFTKVFNAVYDIHLKQREMGAITTEDSKLHFQ